VPGDESSGGKGRGVKITIKIKASPGFQKPNGTSIGAMNILQLDRLIPAISYLEDLAKSIHLYHESRRAG
jgi:hypothetical protein